jgi:hypothetical protein
MNTLMKYLSISIITILIVIIGLPFGFWKYINYQNWKFTNEGVGLNGGDYTRNSNSRIITADGEKFKNLVSENNVAIYETHVKDVNSACGKLDIEKALTTDSNNVKLSFDIGTCSYTSENSAEYLKVANASPNMSGWDFRTYNYKFEPDPTRPIEPVGIDCAAFEERVSTNDDVQVIYKEFHIEFAIRVKNSYNDKVTKKLECNLNNLPAGEYTINYYGRDNSKKIIIK